jgi:signal transduction histidine kinase
VSVRHELSPRQLRALLLLLVLLPLSPTVLMFRFMVETVRNEHAAGEERLGDIYRQALATGSGPLKNYFLTRTPAQRVTPEALFEYYRREFDPGVRVRIVGADGRTLAGDAPDSADPIAEKSAGALLPGAGIQIVPAIPSAAVPADAQINDYGWVVAGVALVNVMVSGAAAISLHRQSRLRELQNSALATVAHELKTPLASMRLLTDTLLGMPEPDPEQCRSYLHLIATENDRLIRLTENFLTLSRFETEGGLPNRSPIEPALLARAALKSVESQLKEAGIQPETTFDDDLPTITVNRESTVVVLANLLDNALKFSDPGTPVALRVRASGGLVQFIVEDHGIGIPAEAQPRIFDCFFQADQKLARTREGCGLGLHIARSIVEAHGGTVTVRSAVGSGSTFCVSLPATKPA